MTDIDHKLSKKFREESDEMLFADIAFSERLKHTIRQQAAAKKKGPRRFLFSKSWMNGVAAMAAAIVLVAGILAYQGPSAQAPAPNQVSDGNAPATNEGVSGSELSQLVTNKLNTAEEARQAFGQGLLVPSDWPEGFVLQEISSVGMPGEPVRDILFTYVSGDKTINYTVSRMEAVFPADLFTKTKIGEHEGSIFAQPTLTELYWMADGVQYAIVGNLTGDEAKKAAASVK